MQSFEPMLFPGPLDDQRLRRYLVDALLATSCALVVTALIFLLKLYPKIPNISFLYLLVVLGLASTRGLYAAIIASLVAFFSFDFFLVEPLYTLSILKPEEWLALFIFLLTAIITGRLASALRQRAEQATQRANETRALYELVKATTSEASLERQLDIVAYALVTNFSTSGVYACAILLPNGYGQLSLVADTSQSRPQVGLSPDEVATAETVLREGTIIDLYGDSAVTPTEKMRPHRYTRQLLAGLAGPRFVRMLPLQLGSHNVGVVRLLMARGSHRLPVERNLPGAQEQVHTQTAFFWTFLDQATAMIERARLQREALQIELLQRTDALRSALLSSVSHDLRTPLASIKAAASSLLQEDVQWDEEAQHSFAVAIEREADRLNRLVGNLLDMSRIEGGALKPEKEWYPINELVHDVLGHMQNALLGREVRVSLPDDLPPVKLDYLQLDQVITNLLENAARYTPSGSPIEISAAVVAADVLIRIADRGPGIPPADLERIFDKFYRVSGTTHKGMGTGLGLAVCRGLVEAHGGRIWAENRPEGGAIFSFTLPI